MGPEIEVGWGEGGTAGEVPARCEAESQGRVGAASPPPRSASPGGERLFGVQENSTIEACLGLSRKTARKPGKRLSPDTPPALSCTGRLRGCDPVHTVGFAESKRR